MPPTYKPLRADKVRYIVVHCSATKASADHVNAAEIDRWHRRQGWNEIGYHYVITRDGRLEKGRPTTVPGAHVRGYNGESVGICMVGGVAEDGKTPEANFTEEQWATLRVIVRQMLKQFPRATVCGHRDLDPKKACPSFDVTDYFARNPLI